MKSRLEKNRGYLLIQVIVFGAVAIVIIAGLIAFAVTNIQFGRRVVLSEQAFQIAEAGLEYYRWHLAHNPTDYTNGTGGAGPYVNNFRDKNGNIIGTFTLTITPPILGSTLVTIQSKGVPTADPSVSRTILTKLAIPSFANFAFVTDAAMRFGPGTEVFGPIHSNDGIRFDGLAHNLVTSMSYAYDDPDHSGANEYGVHTHVNAPPSSGVNNSFRPLEAPNSAVQIRGDVFVAGRSFPAPEVDFDVLESDLTQMKVDAQAAGLYFGASGSQGYRVVLKTNDTLDLYRVNSLQTVPNGCSSSGASGWGSWSTNSATLLGNHPFPPNGLVFLSDHAWVEGTINTARLTIVAARIPDDNSSLRKSITINADVRYTNYDGRDTLALIAQNDINVGMNSSNNLRIDAAVIAQNGRVGRHYYEDDCSPYDERTTITLYGTLITALRYGFAYTDGSGYANRNLIYDSFLLYTPPPFFPKTGDFHEVLFWKEIN